MQEDHKQLRDKDRLYHTCPLEKAANSDHAGKDYVAVGAGGEEEDPILKRKLWYQASESERILKETIIYICDPVMVNEKSKNAGLNITKGTITNLSKF